MSLTSRLKNGWNAFIKNKDPTKTEYRYLGSSYSRRPDRPRLTRGNERTIITPIYNRIAMDVATIDFIHARLDDENRYKETINSSLNNCLTVEANIDQTSRAFIQDVVMSLMDEGCIAIVPVDTDTNPESGSYNINTMRVGKIVEWYPRHVKIKAYNDRTGQKEDIIMDKSTVCIIENPLYAVVNEPASMMQRLIHKLSLLDVIDEQSGSEKLNLIIQLPYTIKSDARRKQADMRREQLETQLAESKYGIAYTDSTEHVTQLNRSLENNLLKQIEYLTSMVYSQLGITKEIMDGSADEQTMTNYYSRTIEPIASAIVDEMNRKFLTKTARSQKQSILFFRDPFKLIPVNTISEMADKFTRNEIMSSNEFRQVIGLKPSSDPKADELVNANISQPEQITEKYVNEEEGGEEFQNGEEQL